MAADELLHEGPGSQFLRKRLRIPAYEMYYRHGAQHAIPSHAPEIVQRPSQGESGTLSYRRCKSGQLRIPTLKDPPSRMPVVSTNP